MKLNRKDIMKKLIFNYKVCTEYATQDKTFEEFEKEFDNNFEHWYKHASIIENYFNNSKGKQNE
tara:strand:+ start:1748 stop:1939 length:192 start_codon:yes stop_codon:yes gene_type:complete